MKARVLGLVLVVTAICAGCAPLKGSQPYEDYRSQIDQMGYFQYMGMASKDLWMDFTDVFHWYVAAGEGIGVVVQPTELLQAGFLFSETACVGWQHRALGTWSEKRSEGGFSMAYYRDYVMDPIYAQPAMFTERKGFQEFALRDNREFHWADLGAKLHVVFLGAGAYVSPKETLDFLMNLCINYPVALFRPVLRPMGLRPSEVDFSDDDTPAQMRKKDGQTWIPQQEGFRPAEDFNEWIRVPY